MSTNLTTVQPFSTNHINTSTQNKNVTTDQLELQDIDDCEHDDLEDGYCLNCGEDRTEWIAMAAYDRAKDRD